MKDLTVIVGAYATFRTEKQPHSGFLVYEEEKGFFLLEEGQHIDSARRFEVKPPKYCEFWNYIHQEFKSELKKYAGAKSYEYNQIHEHFEIVTEKDGLVTKFTPIDPLHVARIYNGNK